MRGQCGECGTSMGAVRVPGLVDDGLPPKNNRRMYSETEIPAVTACRVILSSSSAASLSVRRL